MDYAESGVVLFLKKIGLWVLLSVLVFGLDRVGWIGGVRRTVEIAHSRLASSSGEVVRMFAGPYQAISYWREGVERIEYLEQRLADVVVDEQRLKLLEEENAQLKELSGIESSNLLSGRQVRLFESGAELLIDQGVLHGVAEGMVVVDLAGALVGLVGNTGLYSSRIVTPASRGSIISARIIGKSTTGVLRGDGFRTEMIEVVQSDSLDIGDVLVTSGVNGIYPKDTVVGEVTSLLGNASDITKGAGVALYAKREGVAVLLK